MKLDIFDSYNIRARFSPSVILLSPIALTIFFCFGEIYSLASSTILVCLLLSMTNYIPIMQRALYDRTGIEKLNYVVKLLEFDDQTIDTISKERYYRKLSELDDSFSLFKSPSNSSEFTACCESAVVYLRNNTRDNHLVQEENINYGFFRNMLSSKIPGIIICTAMTLCTILYSVLKFNTAYDIPLNIWMALVSNIVLIMFWIIGINKKMIEPISKRYAITLLNSVDTLKTKNE